MGSLYNTTNLIKMFSLNDKQTQSTTIINEDILASIFYGPVAYE